MAQLSQSIQRERRTFDGSNIVLDLLRLAFHRRLVLLQHHWNSVPKGVQLHVHKKSIVLELSFISPHL